MTEQHGSAKSALYLLLGISRHASDKEIKKAYREAARQFHPDQLRHNESVPRSLLKNQARLFKEITAAYSVLSDNKTRCEYDFAHPDAGIRWNGFQGERFCRAMKTFGKIAPLDEGYLLSDDDDSSAAPALYIDEDQYFFLLIGAAFCLSLLFGLPVLLLML